MQISNYIIHFHTNHCLDFHFGNRLLLSLFRGLVLFVVGGVHETALEIVAGFVLLLLVASVSSKFILLSFVQRKYVARDCALFSVYYSTWNGSLIISFVCHNLSFLSGVISLVIKSLAISSISNSVMCPITFLFDCARTDLLTHLLARAHKWRFAINKWYKSTPVTKTKKN